MVPDESHDSIGRRLVGEIRQRNPDLSDRLVSDSEEDALVAKIQVNEEVIEIRIEAEPHLVIPFRESVVLSVRGSSLLMLLLHFLARIVADDGGEREDRELLEEVEGPEVFPGDELDFYGARFLGHGVWDQWRWRKSRCDFF